MNNGTVVYCTQISIKGCVPLSRIWLKLSDQVLIFLVQVMKGQVCKVQHFYLSILLSVGSFQDFFFFFCKSFLIPIIACPKKIRSFSLLTNIEKCSRSSKWNTPYVISILTYSVTRLKITDCCISRFQVNYIDRYLKLHLMVGKCTP